MQNKVSINRNETNGFDLYILWSYKLVRLIEFPCFVFIYLEIEMSLLRVIYS